MFVLQLYCLFFPLKMQLSILLPVRQTYMACAECYPRNILCTDMNILLLFREMHKKLFMGPFLQIQLSKTLESALNFNLFYLQINRIVYLQSSAVCFLFSVYITTRKIQTDIGQYRHLITGICLFFVLAILK